MRLPKTLRALKDVLKILSNLNFKENRDLNFGKLKTTQKVSNEKFKIIHNQQNIENFRLIKLNFHKLHHFQFQIKFKFIRKKSQNAN
jgi:hypothetical protein